MIYIKTDEEIELLRENNILVSKTLAEVGRHIRPGVTTKFLDSIAEDFIRAHGAVPAFLGYQGFPASLCVSVNEQVVHGIPSSKCVLKEGDIVSVDCGTFMKGFVGDSAYTFAVGEVAEEVRQLSLIHISDVQRRRDKCEHRELHGQTQEPLYQSRASGGSR